MTRREQLAAALAQVHGRIAAAEQAAGRPAGSVKLLPVTKFHPVSDVEDLLALGIVDIAENREQEARLKAQACPQARVHMVGQIQTKKANSVARWAAYVHSVDSSKLVDALDRGMALAIERGDRIEEPLPCFIQLSVDGDPSRGGAPAEDVVQIAESLEAARYLHLQGLMCVPPKDWDPRETFSQAATIKEEMATHFSRPMEFSAGMSGDLEVAIDCGSTTVRVGTAILGNRTVA